MYARRRLGRAALGLHRGGVPHGHHRRHPAPHPGAHRCRRRGDVPTHHDRRRASAGALRGAHPEAVRRRAGQSRVVSLEGRTALVTGGTRGIGLAITRALRRDGARVIAIGKAKEQIEAFRREFAEDPLASVEMADVRDTDALKAVRDRLPGLDILVPNAGVNTRVQALELEDEALWEMIHTNLYGVFVTCQVFGPLLFARP
ncbi:MAG: SDR family oxidoreductase, partial [Chloroflexi bacterium]